MNRLNRHRLEMLERILQFAIDHPEVLARNARVAALFAAVAPIGGWLRTFGMRQASGQRLFRSGAEERSVVAARLRKALRKIYRVAQVLDPREHPGVREKFRMPVDSYRALLDSARAFLTHARPLAGVFVERGRPVGFLEEIETLIAELEAAGQRKHHGRLAQVSGTAGVEAEARRGVRLMRELDVILSDLLEEDEALLAGWRAAAKLERKPGGGAIEPESAEPQSAEWNSGKTMMSDEGWVMSDPHVNVRTDRGRSVASSGAVVTFSPNSLRG